MNIIRLFCHTRRFASCCAAIVTIGLVNVLIGSISFNAGSRNPTDVPLGLILPVITVTAIVAIGEPLTTDIDVVASRPVHRHQAALDSVLYLAASIALFITTTDQPGQAFSNWTVVRNLTGFLGLAWITALVTRQLFAVAAPIILVLMATALGKTPTPLTPTWSWLLDTANTPTSWTIALALLISGFASRLTEPARWTA